MASVINIDSYRACLATLSCDVKFWVWLKTHNYCTDLFPENYSDLSFGLRQAMKIRCNHSVSGVIALLLVS